MRTREGEVTLVAVAVELRSPEEFLTHAKVASRVGKPDTERTSYCNPTAGGDRGGPYWRRWEVTTFDPRRARATARFAHTRA